LCKLLAKLAHCAFPQELFFWGGRANLDGALENIIAELGKEDHSKVSQLMPCTTP
jgi:hypothetical protein